MASEPAKPPNPGGQEHLQPHPIVTYPPQQYGGQYPPPVPYPPYYAYAPVPDGSHDPSATNGAPPPPYFISLPPPPPGMVYAYPAPPPGQGFPPYPPQMQPAAPPVRPKRKQVKMACTNCATACKRCDEARPCERCVKYGIADSCVDGVRKERKKGVKRGPYKRKNKSGDQPTNADSSGEGEGVPPPTPYAAPPEGYYPYVYPHPYVPPPHDGQPHPEGVPGGHVPHPPYYPGYPVYAPYGPYPGAPPMPYPPPAMAPPPTSKPPETSTVAPAEVNGNGDAAHKHKKRSRVKSSEDTGARSKKTKHTGDPQADSEAPRSIGQGEAAAPVYAPVDSSRTMVAV